MDAVPGSTRGLTVGLLLCVTAIAFEAQSVLTAMPAAADDLGQLDLYAWAFTAFVIPQLVAIVVAGRLCDSIGPVRPFLLGLVLFAVGIVVAAMAPTMPVLLMGRFVQGAGAGTVNLTLMVMVGLVYAPEARASLMTWFSAAWMLPSFLGPVAAAWLSEQFSWHWVFWAVLPFVAIGVTFMAPRLRRLDLARGPHTASPAHAIAAVVTAIGVAALQAAGQGIGAASVPVALGGLLMLGFGLRPLLPGGRLAVGRGLPSVVLVRCLSAGSFFAAQAFVPLVMTRGLGLGLFEAGLAITVASSGWMVGSWLQSRPWLVWRRDVIVAVGCWLVAAGILGCALAVQVGAGQWPLVAAMAVAGLGMGLAMASTSLVLMQLSPEESLGFNSSALQVGEVVGSAVLAGVAGTVFVAMSSLGDARLTFAVLLGVLGVCAAAGGLAVPRVGQVPNLSARPTLLPG